MFLASMGEFPLYILDEHYRIVKCLQQWVGFEVGQKLVAKTQYDITPLTQEQQMEYL